jgi:hypothetical protein
MVVNVSPMSAFGFHLPRATIDRGMASCLEYALGDCGLRSKKEKYKAPF